MQINYDMYGDRRANASRFMYNIPAIDNSLQEVDVPCLYAPYGTPGWWPQGSTPPSPAAASIAPNSGEGISVASAMLNGLAGLGDFAPGLTPSDLVAPMPSIIAPRPSNNTPDTTCQISSWVQNNTGLAVLAAVAVFGLAAGGRK